jgi:hypothetical protein
MSKSASCPTGHAIYSFIKVCGIRHAECRDCSAQWLIVLSGDTGHTDEIGNDVPGVQARAKR